MQRFLDYEKDSGVAVVTMNRPRAALNSLSAKTKPARGSDA